MNQATFLRNISGEKRLEQALTLSDFIRELAINNIRKDLGKKASKNQILTKLRQRIESI